MDELFYPFRRHIIWLNNLFINIKLLTKFCDIGIKGIGTVYTTKIKYKELGDSEGDILIRAKRNKKRFLLSRLIRDSLTLSSIIQLSYHRVFYTEPPQRT